MNSIRGIHVVMAVLILGLVAPLAAAGKGSGGKPGGGDGGGTPPTPLTVGDWNTSKGGLYDAEAGLVWGTTQTNWTHDGAANELPSLYEQQWYAYGQTGWRLPSRQELERAVAQDIYGALTDAAATYGFTPPEQSDAPYWFWTSDRKGKFYYAVDLHNPGDVRLWDGNYLSGAILVREDA